MTHPIPPGTRDILPDEMRELRRLSLALIEAFERFGYGEVSTPTIEYEEVLARGESERGAPVAYRFFDESGELLAMRSDMTIPIARLVANRYASAEPPFRLCYLATAHRAIRPQRGQMREFTQAGVELVGAPAPEGTAEVVEVLATALDAAGLNRAVIGLGDADLYRSLLRELGVGDEPRARLLEFLATHDHVGLEVEVAALDLAADERELLVRIPMLRGGPEVLDEARALCGETTARATARLAATFDARAGPRRRRPGEPRPRPPARPRLLHRGDPRGLRPGARSHPRRRRALRRADGSLRPAADGGGLLAVPGAAARRPDRGGAPRPARGRAP